MNYQILTGDNRITLKTLPDDSVDAIITDPPYGIDFLGKSWDANTGALETYQECLRVLKPGGHILAFSAARTYHHLAITLEQAGFEIRDQIMWIYSSGFPKSQDIGKSIDRAAGKKREKFAVGGETYTINEGKQKKGISNECKICGCKSMGVGGLVCGHPRESGPITEEAKVWSGWGTQLKPAHEPIALARKPIKLSIARNCQTYGVGALNIDAARIPFEDEDDASLINDWKDKWGGNQTGGAPVFQGTEVKKKKKSDIETYLNNKRGPMERAKIKDGENIGMFDGGVGYKAIKRVVDPAVDLPAGGRFPSNVIGDIPDYQKYFYCPKVSRKERHIGLRDPGALFSGSRTDIYQPKNNGIDISMPTVEKNSEGTNNHPTVKPIELMKYLIKLITPEGGTVLDPFNGSGSTGCAAVELGHPYIGCELDPKYVEIARKRIEAWYKSTRDPAADIFNDH